MYKTCSKFGLVSLWGNFGGVAQNHTFLIWDKFCTFVFQTPTCPDDVRTMYARCTRVHAYTRTRVCASPIIEFGKPRAHGVGIYVVEGSQDGAIHGYHNLRSSHGRGCRQERIES